MLAVATCANAAFPAHDVTAEALGIPPAAFVPPALARKAAVLEACIENPEPSLAVTTILYADVVEARDADNAPLYFYEVIVVAGRDGAPDFGRLAGLVEIPAGGDDEKPTAAGTWTLTEEGKKARDGLFSRSGGPIVAMMLVPATTAYPMLVVPSAGFALWRPALAAAAAGITPSAAFGPPRAVVGGTGQYLLFESERDAVAFELFDYGSVAAENRPYFTGTGALESYLQAAVPEARGDDEDARWSAAVRSLWPWLDETIPDGETVTVDAAQIEHKYNEYMQKLMGGVPDVTEPPVAP
jgi:hypothetical protein